MSTMCKKIRKCSYCGEIHKEKTCPEMLQDDYNGDPKELAEFIDDKVLEAKKDAIRIVEERYSLNQFGRKFARLGKDYPDYVRFITITYKDWEDLKKEFLKK